MIRAMGMAVGMAGDYGDSVLAMAVAVSMEVWVIWWQQWRLGMCGGGVVGVCWVLWFSLGFGSSAFFRCFYRFLRWYGGCGGNVGGRNRWQPRFGFVI